MRWGDPVLPGAPPFDPMTQSAAAQKLQFGYNNDFVGYLPMPGVGNPSHHGLLVVNHEYTNEELMFPGIAADQTSREQKFAKMTKELVAIEMAAHGGTVIEIKRANGKWQCDRADRNTPAASTSTRQWTSPVQPPVTTG